MKNKNILRIALVTICILLIPLVAMQFTDEVNWTISDFIVAGVLLFGTGFSYEFVASKSGNIMYRAAVGIAVGAALLLVWVNLAVGIIGSENNPANLIYFGVLVIGIIGAFIARFSPQGMAHALFATAFVQVLVPVIALIISKPAFSEPPGFVGIFALNAFFALLFTVSALLFRRAGMISSKEERAA